jgi:hypothetical protein
MRVRIMCFRIQHATHVLSQVSQYRGKCAMISKNLLDWSCQHCGAFWPEAPFRCGCGVYPRGWVCPFCLRFEPRAPHRCSACGLSDVPELECGACGWQSEFHVYPASHVGKDRLGAVLCPCCWHPLAWTCARGECPWQGRDVHMLMVWLDPGLTCLEQPVCPRCGDRALCLGVYLAAG